MAARDLRGKANGLRIPGVQHIWRFLRAQQIDLSHDYKRHGTTTLFAALDVATGKVTGRHYRRHEESRGPVAGTG